MKRSIAEQRATCADTTRAEPTGTTENIPDSTLELIARLDPTFFSPTSAARRALAVDRPVNLGRHKRNCSICSHPERDTIEQSFLHWHSPEEIAEQFGLPDWSSVYRHVRAFGLFAERRRNIRYAVESIIERVHEIQVVTPSGFVSAVRAFTCINEEGEWVEPTKRVIVTHVSIAASPQQAEEGESGDSFAPPATEAKTAGPLYEAGGPAEKVEALKENPK